MSREGTDGLVIRPTVGVSRVAEAPHVMMAASALKRVVVMLPPSCRFPWSSCSFSTEPSVEELTELGTLMEPALAAKAAERANADDIALLRQSVKDFENSKHDRVKLIASDQCHTCFGFLSAGVSHIGIGFLF